ncbi:hypothetical protein [Blautia wexlerae]|uniref:hypothetical protein n=1 Tax=Blautia wexlerae TaxID=418240 RepID=UPI0034A49DC6
MTNDVKVAIVFVVMLILVCRAWSCFGVRQYKKNKKNKLNLTYSVCADSAIKLGIVGIGNDENGDYKVSEAIENIELSSNIRIKLYE